MFHGGGKSESIDIGTLDAFFEALEHYGEGDLMRMSAAWRAVSAQDHEDAWTVVRTTGARDGFSKEIDGIRDRALTWASRGSDVFPYTLEDSVAWAQVKRDAAEAIGRGARHGARQPVRREDAGDLARFLGRQTSRRRIGANRGAAMAPTRPFRAPDVGCPRGRPCC